MKPHATAQFKPAGDPSLNAVPGPTSGPGPTQTAAMPQVQNQTPPQAVSMAANPRGPVVHAEYKPKSQNYPGQARGVPEQMQMFPPEMMEQQPGAGGAPPFKLGGYPGAHSRGTFASSGNYSPGMPHQGGVPPQGATGSPSQHHHQHPHPHQHQPGMQSSAMDGNARGMPHTMHQQQSTVHIGPQAHQPRMRGMMRGGPQGGTYGPRPAPNQRVHAPQSQYYPMPVQGYPLPQQYPPYYMPMQMGAGVSMPMQHQHQQPAPAPREKKILAIVDPKTGKQLDIKSKQKKGAGDAASSSASSTAATSDASPTKAVATPDSSLSPTSQETAQKSPVKQETKPSPAKSPAKPGFSAAEEFKRLAAEAKNKGSSPAKPPVEGKAAEEEDEQVMETTAIQFGTMAIALDSEEELTSPSTEAHSPVKTSVAEPTRQPAPAESKAYTPTKSDIPKKAEVDLESASPAAKKPEKEKAISPIPSPEKAMLPMSPLVKPQSPVATNTKGESPVVSPSSREQSNTTSSPVVADEDKSSQSSAKAEKPVPEEKPSTEVSDINSTDKVVYTIEFLLKFRDDFKELPDSVSEGSKPWPSMEIVNEGPVRGSGRGRGGGWERQNSQQLGRQGSRGGGGGGQWQRSQELPKRGRGAGGRGGKGGRGGQDLSPFDGSPVKPLERSANRWIPSKSTSKLEAAQKTVQSIMNKMTREKFDRLSKNLVDIEMVSLEMLQAVIKIIFEKALGEPHFCDMYADLCVFLESHWRSWSFLKVLSNDDDNAYYWVALGESDSDVIGPFDSTEDALEDAISSEENDPIPAPAKMEIAEVRVRHQKFVKIWVAKEDDGSKPQYYWSGQLVEDLGDDQRLEGPYTDFEQASRSAMKSCSFKRILLNACQEEFEKDNIYEELEVQFKKDKKENKLTPEMEAEYEEKRFIMKCRMLGNIRFIGELFRKGMLQERIMHECITKLMDVKLAPNSKTGVAECVPVHPNDNPDEENLESLCKLLTTMGKDLERSDKHGFIRCYFQHLEKLSADKRLCSRIVFMIKDLIDLRNNRWEPRRKELKQKTLTEIRKEAERESQRPPSSAPLPRGDSYRTDVRRGGSFRDGGAGGNSRSTMAPVYSQPQSARGSVNRVPLGAMRGIQRDDSIKAGVQGRPTSFMSARKGMSARRNAPLDTNSNNAKSPVKTQSKPTAPRVTPLTDEVKEKIAKKAKSIAEEFVGLEDYDEAEACVKLLLEEHNKHPDVAQVFAKEILSTAAEAKDRARLLMFDLVYKLSCETKVLSMEGVRFGIEKAVEMGPDLWCDVPKLHEHTADLICRFLKKSEETGVTLDWIMCGCGNAMDNEMMESAVDSGFMAALCGMCLKLLKTSDAERAKKEIQDTHSTFFSLLPTFDRNYKNLQKWLEKHDLQELFPLDKAFEFAEMLEKKAPLNDLIAWSETNVTNTLKGDRVFLPHLLLLVLGFGDDDDSSLTSDQCSLLMGFCGDVEMQARFANAIVQTRSSLDEVKRIFEKLTQESAITKQGLVKWMENEKSRNSSTVEELAGFIEQLGGK